MARMSIDDMIARDTRVDRLAKLCGWSRRETRACLEEVWALCYDRVVPYLPAEDIEVTAARDAISPPPVTGFTAALRLVGLARDATAADRHFIRKDGTRVPWPDQNWRDRVYLSGAAERVGYLLTKRSAGSEGGVKSGQSRRSKTKQSFNSASSESQARGNPPDPVPDSAPDPVPEDQNLPPARDPAVAVPSYEPERTLRSSPPPAPAPILPGSIARAEAKRRLIGEAWQLGGDAFRELGREGIEPKAFDPWAGMPGADDEGMKLLIARVDRLLIGDPPEVERARLVFQRRIAVAKAEGRAASPPTRRWITPMRLWNPESFAKGAEMSPEQVRPRTPAPRRGDPLPPAPPPKRPDPPPPDPVLSPEDRAAIAELAARVGANPEAAAAELKTRPAHLPTAELVKRFGDGQRAPPASATPTNPDDPTRRRKAAT